jgi:hypothetical protein
MAGAAIWILLAIGATPARAEPAFAVTTGYSCRQCHVNRTGGGMRNAFGSLYAQTILPARLLRVGGRGYLLPADPEARYGVGGDARVGYYAVISDDYDDSSSFEIPSANVYGQVSIVPQRLSFYLDQDVGSGSSSTQELFGLLSSRNGKTYVKAGKFYLPYGWALPDDDAFIREPLGFAFTGPDNGVEVGYEPANWSLHLAVTNGNFATRDDDREKKFTLRTERRFKTSRLGLSASNNLSGGATSTWAGLYAGLNLGRLSLLAEGDWRRVRPDEAPTVETWVGYVETNLMLTRGMNVKYAHDWIDPNRDVDTDQRQRDSLGFEYIPYPFVQLRAFVRRKDGPRLRPGANDDQVDVEVHLFF